MSRKISALALGTVLVMGSACSSPPTNSNGPVDAATADATPLTDAGAIDATDGSADFSIDIGRSQIDLSLGTETFAQDSCELAASEQCVGAAGERRVLRFSVETLNLGDADISLGPPGSNPNYEFSDCHGHYHFRGYASYRLLGSDGSELLVGRKQAFCLLDSEPYTDFAADSRKYHCENQGLQAGWADVYAADLPCQFLDVTNIADGDYTLEVAVNPEGLLQDSDVGNNVATIPVRIGNSDLETPTEECPAMDARYLDRIQRECDWDFVGTFACTPGTQTGAGCSQNCGVGSCSGNPMLRVCDGADPNCTSGIALGANDNRCGGPCPLASGFLCPESGQLAVYSASAEHGQPYQCDVVISAGPTSP